jgi:hypothetical protein
MRVATSIVLTAVLWAGSAVTAFGQAVDAAQVLAAARQALGGDDKLAGVTSFVATGRTRQIRGNNIVPIEFEVSCELPDRFVRRDEFPAQDTDPTLTGFSRDDLILFPPPPAAPPGRGPAPQSGAAPQAAGRGGPPNPAQQRLSGIKQDFVRLTLGMFAASFPSYPLTFTYAAEGDAPEGKADILDVKGPESFSVRLVVQRDTHLPVMLMWQLPATNVVVRLPGQALPTPLPPGTVVVDAPAPPAETAPKEDQDRYLTTVAGLRKQALSTAKPIEYRIYYGDFRTVDGFKWPFRLRRAVAGETVEETTFDRFRVNVRIDPRKFEAPR